MDAVFACDTCAETAATSIEWRSACDREAECKCECASVGKAGRIEEQGEPVAEREERLKNVDDVGGEPTGVVEADPHAKSGLV